MAYRAGYCDQGSSRRHLFGRDCVEVDSYFESQYRAAKRETRLAVRKALTGSANSVRAVSRERKFIEFKVVRISDGLYALAASYRIALWIVLFRHRRKTGKLALLSTNLKGNPVRNPRLVEYLETAKPNPVFQRTAFGSR